MELVCQNVLNALQKREFKPIYFLMGEEPYYIDKITDWMEGNVLPEDARAFNQMVLYGKDVDVENVVLTARAFPMSGDLQLIVVKEAQQLKNIEKLKAYVEYPQPSTVLVVAYKYGTPDKRKCQSLLNAIEKVGVLFESSKVKDNQIPGKVSEIAKELGLAIDNQAANMIASFLGSDLSKIAGELSKLKIAVPTGTLITAEVVERNVGISKEYNAFELTNALSVKDVELAMKIVNYCKKDKQMSERMPLVISNIYNFFSNLLVVYVLPDRSEGAIAKSLGVNLYAAKYLRRAMNLYSFEKVTRIIDYIREADGMTKGVGNVSIKAPDILSILVFKILH